MVLALAILVAFGGTLWLFWRSDGYVTSEKQPLGLFTSLPILWSEQAALRDMLSAPEKPHWAKTVLDKRGTTVALNTLLDPGQYKRLVIAQPRPLSPDENVALDQWVRAGGRALVFVDPMLTHESAFALGDRRRPQDVVLVSPILRRWGLELQFDETQPGGMRESAGAAFPVNLAGQFVAVKGNLPRQCEIRWQGLVALCLVGKGRVLLVADAALLEGGGDMPVHADRFGDLLDEAFDD